MVRKRPRAFEPATFGWVVIRAESYLFVSAYGGSRGILSFSIS
jgi:hypothetical protein